MPQSNNILKNNVIVRKAFFNFLSLLLFGFELSELFLDRLMCSLLTFFAVIQNNFLKQPFP